MPNDQVDQKDKNNVSGNPEGDDKFVPKDLYQKTAKDMLEYKSQLKELQAQLSAIKADEDAKKTQTLKEQEKWAELAKKWEDENKTLKAGLEQERNKFLDYHKVASVVSKIGGFKKPEYSDRIRKDAIKINEDGSIDEASVLSEVERIKKEYPELLVATKVNEPPTGGSLQGNGKKDLSKMTPVELAQYKRELLKQSKTK